VSLAGDAVEEAEEEEDVLAVLDVTLVQFITTVPFTVIVSLIGM
jgi:hypothetical protein